MVYAQEIVTQEFALKSCLIAVSKVVPSHISPSGVLMCRLTQFALPFSAAMLLLPQVAFQKKSSWFVCFVLFIY